MHRIQNIEAVTAPDHQGRTPLSIASRLLDRLYIWQARIDGRRELAHLDERMLKDAGMSRADVLLESSKPFWRA